MYVMTYIPVAHHSFITKLSWMLIGAPMVVSLQAVRQITGGQVSTYWG
jgi:hypothetical protein